jgi:hypothetical protein
MLALAALVPLTGIVVAQTTQPTIFDPDFPGTTPTRRPDPTPPVRPPEVSPAAPGDPTPPATEAPAPAAATDSPAHPAPTSDAAKAALAKYQAALASADTAFTTASGGATTAYLDGINRAKSQAMIDRKLEAANWCDAEIKRVKAGEAVATDGGDTPAVRNARQRHAATLKTATDRQRDAHAAARRLCINELDAAAKLALRNKQLDEANAITAVVADLKAANESRNPAALPHGEEIVFAGTRATIVEGRPAEREYTLRFTLTGQTIEGSIEFTGYGSFPLRGRQRDGRIEFVVEPAGSKLRQTYTGTVSGQEVKLKFSGVTLDGKQIEGTATGMRQRK